MPRRGVPAPRRAARRLGLAALAAVTLAGCTAGPSARPPVVENDGPPPSQGQQKPGEAPVPPLGRPRPSAVDWTDCDEQTRARLGSTDVPESLRFSCARVNTTLDAPDLPRRGLIRIAVLKVGEGPIPLTVVNDVDGEPGTLYAARLAASLPPELLQRFHLVGVDRRGTGDSDPVACIRPETRERLLGYDPARTEVGPLLDAARRAGQQCTIGLENGQTAYDTWRAAGDLDELREQLGIEDLHALGHGEGSSVLTAYAARFPDRVGRMVLDGLPDPSPDPAVVLAGIAAGTVSTLEAFGKSCAAKGCGLGDARQAVTELAERLRAAPLVAGGVRLGPGLALRAVRAGLAQRDRWPELAGAIEAARSGDAGGLVAFVEPMLSGSGDAAARLDGALAIMCNDSTDRLPQNRIDQILADLAGKHPLFGPLVGQRLAWCSPWPVRREPPPPEHSPGAPPIVVASTAADPVTPEPGTIRAAEQLPTSVRIAWQGAGHGALASPCITAEVTGFLLDGKVPGDGTLCPA